MLATIKRMVPTSLPSQLRILKRLSPLPVRVDTARWQRARCKQGDEQLTFWQRRRCIPTCARPCGLHFAAQAPTAPISSSSVCKAATASTAQATSAATVLIVESPTKAHKIQKYLGPDYLVQHLPVSRHPTHHACIIPACYAAHLQAGSISHHMLQSFAASQSCLKTPQDTPRDPCTRASCTWSKLQRKPCSNGSLPAGAG